jgi:hypothetical protein
MTFLPSIVRHEAADADSVVVEVEPDAIYVGGEKSVDTKKPARCREISEQKNGDFDTNFIQLFWQE